MRRVSLRRSWLWQALLLCAPASAFCQARAIQPAVFDAAGAARSGWLPILRSLDAWEIPLAVRDDGLRPPSLHRMDWADPEKTALLAPLCQHLSAAGPRLLRDAARVGVLAPKRQREVLAAVVSSVHRAQPEVEAHLRRLEDEIVFKNRHAGEPEDVAGLKRRIAEVRAVHVLARRLSFYGPQIDEHVRWSRAQLSYLNSRLVQALARPNETSWDGTARP